MAKADPQSGLIPENLDAGIDHWNGRNNAADNYPFMVLTAALTDRPLFDGRLMEMLRTEQRLTSRVDRLGDYYRFSTRSFEFPTIDMDRIIFDNSEYVKDGLMPLTEWLGPSPWSERMAGIVDDFWKHAAVDTAAGKIPSTNPEVNGDMMQLTSRYFWMTGDRKYLDPSRASPTTICSATAIPRAKTAAETARSRLRVDFGPDRGLLRLLACQQGETRAIPRTVAPDARRYPEVWSQRTRHDVQRHQPADGCRDPRGCPTTGATTTTASTRSTWWMVRRSIGRRCDTR